MFGWRLYRVRGRSMQPTLRDGDYALARLAGHGRTPRSGDIVCLRRPNEIQMIKRLGLRRDDGSFQLSGDGGSSAPAVDLGSVKLSHIQARVVMRIGINGIRAIRTRQ